MRQLPQAVGHLPRPVHLRRPPATARRWCASRDRTTCQRTSGWTRSRSAAHCARKTPCHRPPPNVIALGASLEECWEVRRKAREGATSTAAEASEGAEQAGEAGGQARQRRLRPALCGRLPTVTCAADGARSPRPRGWADSTRTTAQLLLRRRPHASGSSLAERPRDEALLRLGFRGGGLA